MKNVFEFIKNKRIVIGIISCVVVIAIATGVFVITRNNQVIARENQNNDLDMAVNNNDNLEDEIQSGEDINKSPEQVESSDNDNVKGEESQTTNNSIPADNVNNSNGNNTSNTSNNTSNSSNNSSTNNNSASNNTSQSNNTNNNNSNSSSQSNQTQESNNSNTEQTNQTNTNNNNNNQIPPTEAEILAQNKFVRFVPNMTMASKVMGTANKYLSQDWRDRGFTISISSSPFDNYQNNYFTYRETEIEGYCLSINVGNIYVYAVDEIWTNGTSEYVFQTRCYLKRM